MFKKVVVFLFLLRLLAYDSFGNLIPIAGNIESMQEFCTTFFGKVRFTITLENMQQNIEAFSKHHILLS